MLVGHTHRGRPSALGRLFDDYENYFFNQPMEATGRRTFAPTFDMRETKDNYQLEGELPGVKESEVDIEYSDPHTLNIKGHTESSSQREGESWWVSERMRGDFRRTFTFPSDVSQENTQASLKDGILSVTVPKVNQKPEIMKVKLVTD